MIYTHTAHTSRCDNHYFPLPLAVHFLPSVQGVYHAQRPAEAVPYYSVYIGVVGVVLLVCIVHVSVYVGVYIKRTEHELVYT